VNRPMTLVDRLRIERVLWTVDILIYDIRTARRRTIRRELRTNLRAAAREQGVGAAIRQLGPLRQLATGYVDAQYGERARRPRWMRAIWWAFVCALLIEAFILVSFSAYVAGVSAGNPGANGIYVWNQLAGYGLGTFKVWFVHGQTHSFEATFNLAYEAAAGIIGGRLWRVVTRRRSSASAV
jgi:hypothetical protein